MLTSLGTVLIRSNLTLTKPLVVSSNVQIEVAPGAELTLAAQPVLPNRKVGGVGERDAVGCACREADGHTGRSSDG